MNLWVDVYTNYSKLMPLNQMIFYNIFLYYSLHNMPEKNMGLKVHDRKTCRKRNLVPAKTGMVHLFFYIFLFIFFVIPSGTKHFDKGTRAFVNCLVTDIAYAIMCLVIILSGNQVAM